MSFTSLRLFCLINDISRPTDTVTKVCVTTALVSYSKDRKKGCYRHQLLFDNYSMCHLSSLIIQHFIKYFKFQAMITSKILIAIFWSSDYILLEQKRKT